MNKLDEQNKVLIEELYFNVKAYLESEYNTEGVIDVTKKSSTKIIFKDRKKAITLIKEAILNFASENNIDVKLVKDYLLKMIERDIELDNGFKEEYEHVKEIISMDDDER